MVGTEGQTPYEWATSGRYVAMGDSFASGEGAWNYQQGTDLEDRDDWWPFNDNHEAHNRCHRSTNAYSQIIAAGNDFAGGHDFVACSGSTTQQFGNANDKQTGEAPQFDALGEDVSFVTVTIGGNDLGFSAILKACIGVSVVSGHQVDCRSSQDKKILAEQAALRAKLLASYQQIRSKAPNARVVVVGYPSLFAEDKSADDSVPLTAEERSWMNSKAGQLNSMLSSVAAEAGVEFLDPTDAFRSHGLGSTEPWINDLDLGGPGMMLKDPSSLHPNAAGQAAIAKLVQAQLENPQE